MHGKARLGRGASKLAVVQQQGLRRQLLWCFHFCRTHPTGALSLGVLLVAFFAGVFAPILAPYDPIAAISSDRLKPPAMAHWLGTDNFGRDLYSNILFGTRVTFRVAFVSIGIGTGSGLVLGVLSGYLGGRADNIIQRVTEIFLAFPIVVLSLALIAVLGTGEDKVIIALSVVFCPRTIRVMRGVTLQVRQNTYVEAAQALGASPARIMARHILPNVAAPYIIVATTLLGAAITTEATLSFLGLGVPPPSPSLGRMLGSNASLFTISAPWMIFFPGFAISIVVLAFNLFGDTLRDVWDPKLRGR